MYCVRDIGTQSMPFFPTIEAQGWNKPPFARTTAVKQEE
jgi:hypothetical protein